MTKLDRSFRWWYDFAMFLSNQTPAEVGCVFILAMVILIVVAKLLV